MSEDHPVYEQHPFLHQATEQPTADAAKQDDHRAKWTLASGDEMFLVGEDGVGLNAGGHVIVKPLREWHALASTRPQPAPPTGEPDELDAILSRAGWALYEATWRFPVGCQSPGWVPECVEAQRLIAEYQRARRLGPAVWPKVEDGSWYLEKDIDALMDRAEAAESKLVEREAELQAYRDAAIYDPLMDGPRFKTWNRSQLDRARDITERHAARQQQNGGSR